MTPVIKRLDSYDNSILPKVIDAICAVAVLTGKDDGTGYDTDPNRWVLPYLQAHPELCFVLEGPDRPVNGYILGTTDPDECFQPPGYTAHFHINIVEQFRGMGYGHDLVDCFLSAVEQPTFCGVAKANINAQWFYRSCGFALLPEHSSETAVWYGYPAPENLR